MLACLPPEELPSKLLKTVFLHRLPGDLKDLVAVQFQQLEARELAKFGYMPLHAWSATGLHGQGWL